MQSPMDYINHFKVFGYSTHQTSGKKPVQSPYIGNLFGNFKELSWASLLILSYPNGTTYLPAVKTLSNAFTAATNSDWSVAVNI